MRMGTRRVVILRGLMIISSVLLSIAANAQPTEPPLVPVDGGVSILIAAGALLGVKKIFEFAKNKRK